MKDNVIARLTVQGIPTMSKTMRKTVVEWLRRHAAEIEKDYTQYTEKRFTAKVLQ